jgi:hypothetical protein
MKQREEGSQGRRHRRREREEEKVSTDVVLLLQLSAQYGVSLALS